MNFLNTITVSLIIQNKFVTQENQNEKLLKIKNQLKSDRFLF